MDTVVSNQQLIEPSPFFWELKLIERIRSGLRKIGCIHFVKFGDNITFLDVEFKFCQSFTIGRKDFKIIICKADLPDGFDYYDLVARGKILQFEIGMPLRLYEKKDYVFIELHPGTLFNIS